MTNEALIDLFIENPVIAAVRSPEMLESAIASGAAIVFLLHGSVNTLAKEAKRLSNAGKTVFLHIDMAAGLHADSAGIEFVKNTAISGIISTKPSAIRLAQAAKLHTIQRSFLLDSAALNTTRQNAACGPDLIEILPGICPEIVEIAKSKLETPIVAGGFIKEKKHLFAALGAGALAASTSEIALWP